MKWSQGYSNNDIEIIHKLSIILLVLICAYIVAYIVLLCLIKHESQSLKAQSHAAAVIFLLFWIACLVIFMLLMTYVENFDFNKFPKRRKIRKFKGVFHAFAILEMIVELLDKVDDLLKERVEEYNDHLSKNNRYSYY